MAARAKIVALCVGLPVLLAGGFGVFLITKYLVQDTGAAAAQPAPESTAATVSTTESAAETSTSTTPTTPAVAPIKCGAVATASVNGGSIESLSPIVRGIHDAACARDYVGLLGYMEEDFGGLPRKDVVAGWKRHDADGTVLQAMAEALESQPVVDQGGYTFCSPGGAVLSIARGLVDHPALWSGFDPTGKQLPGCAGRR